MCTTLQSNSIKTVCVLHYSLTQLKQYVVLHYSLTQLKPVCVLHYSLTQLKQYVVLHYKLTQLKQLCVLHCKLTQLKQLYTIIKFYLLQVLYKDNTWVMGHVITKRLKGAETKLMKCLKSMPSNLSEPVNTCYTAGVHYLESGSVLELSVPRQSAELILWSHATFMGIFSI
uniref:TNF superfamily member 13 n=1 Tax=Astyanax mexicanus TaxID=7994 RepID=A0A3B1JL37_ASTMX